MIGKRKPAAILAALALSAAASGCTGGVTAEASASTPGGAATRGCEPSTSTDVPQPTAAQMKAAGLSKLPVAPDSQRADLVAPAFSDPTSVTNPLFPISDLHSAVLAGRVDDKPFKTETTLLPETRIIEWSEGQCIRTLVSQYAAYLDGRLEEVALDLYAQADDGSVWYFGEDVFNYNRKGKIADTHGTWLAGKEGPAAMIMPADPAIDDVNRPENIPGLVFEEVRVKTVDQTVDGPYGPVDGVMTGEELHDDGSFSDKVFAPGYGEWLSAHEGDVEAMALAVPVNALPGPPPAELVALSEGADRIFERPRSWSSISTTLDEMRAAWDTYRADGVSRWLDLRTRRALKDLAKAIRVHDSLKVRQAAIDIAYSSVDLQLRHRPPAEIDLARFELWARQVIVDAAADNLSGVTIDLATLEWIRDRFVQSLDALDVTRIDAQLLELRINVDDEDLGAASDTASALREIVAGLG